MADQLTTPTTGQAAGMRYLGGDYYGDPATQRTYDTQTKTYSTNYNWLVGQLQAQGKYVEPGQPNLTPQQIDAQAKAQRALRSEDYARQQNVAKGSFAGREAQIRLAGGEPQKPVVGIEQFKISEQQSQAARARPQQPRDQGAQVVQQIYPKASDLSPIKNRIPAPYSTENRLEGYVFEQPWMTNVDKMVGESQFNKLPRIEKAGLLVTTGFAKPEIAASYLESKISGKPTGYQEAVYKYAMKDSKSFDVLGTKFAIPKTDVLKDVGVGVVSTVALGAAFKGLSYLGSPIVKGAAGGVGKAVGYAESKLGEAAARTSGTVTKTTLQTSETLLDIGKKPIAWAARNPEKVIGAGFVAPFVANVAQSKTKGEAAEKILRAAVTLPLMGEGYKAAERVGYAMPTASEFKGFVASKASPIVTKYEPDITARMNRLPDTVQKNIQTIQSKFVKEPSGYDLMTPTAREIYKGLPTPQAKIMMEQSAILTHELENLPVGKTYPLDLTKVKYAGNIGKGIANLAKQSPGEYTIGGSASVRSYIPTFRAGADIDLTARNYKKAVEQVSKLTEQTYPGSSMKGEVFNPKSRITTFKQKSGESIIDIHNRALEQMSGEPITTSFMGESNVKLVRSRVREPVRIGGISTLHITEQMARKEEGMIKYLARKTISPESPHYKSLESRQKDVADRVNILKARVSEAIQQKPQRAEKLTKHLKAFEEAEATKLYSGLPIEKSGYYIAKEYKGMVKTPPILTGYGKGNYPETPKRSFGYPLTLPKGAYPVPTKRDNGVYPSINKPKITIPTGYPQQNKVGYPYPPSYPDIYPPPTYTPPKTPKSPGFYQPPEPPKNPLLYYPEIFRKGKSKSKKPAFRGYLKTYKLGAAESLFAQVEAAKKRLNVNVKKYKKTKKSKKKSRK